MNSKPFLIALLACSSATAQDGLGVGTNAFTTPIEDAGFEMSFEEGTTFGVPYLHATWPPDPTEFLVISLYLEGQPQDLQAVDVECYGQNAVMVAGLFPNACATFMGLLLAVTLPEWDDRIDWLSDAMARSIAADGISIVDRSITVNDQRGSRDVTFLNFQTGPVGLRIASVLSQ